MNKPLASIIITISIVALWVLIIFGIPYQINKASHYHAQNPQVYQLNDTQLQLHFKSMVTYEDAANYIKQHNYKVIAISEQPHKDFFYIVEHND